MQTHGDALVELTVVMDRDDYRRLLSTRRRSWSVVIFPLCALGALFTALACDLLGSAILTLITLLLLILSLQLRRRAVRTLPDWAYAPFTYRFTPDSVTLTTPVSRHETSWTALPQRRRTEHAYVFTGPGAYGVALMRRTLTQQDEAALDALLARIA